MEFKLRCECGEDISVSEGAAGSIKGCTCGRTVHVPSLTELRLQAGLPPQPPNPTVVIPLLAAEGSLPTLSTCVRCNSPTDDVGIVTVECEIISHEGAGVGSKSGSTAAFALLLSFVGIWAIVLEQLRGRDDRPQDCGDSRIVHCPMRMCGSCRVKMSRNSTFWFRVALGQAALGIIVAVAWSAWGLLFLVPATATWWVEVAARNRHESTLKQLLTREPAYEDLLSDFPKAHVSLQVD